MTSRARAHPGIDKRRIDELIRYADDIAVSPGYPVRRTLRAFILGATIGIVLVIFVGAAIV